MVIKMFGFIVAFSTTPYTLEECEMSLYVLELPEVLEAEAYCTEDLPVLNYVDMPQEQKDIIAKWTEEMEVE